MQDSCRRHSQWLASAKSPDTDPRIWCSVSVGGNDARRTRASLGATSFSEDSQDVTPSLYVFARPVPRDDWSLVVKRKGSERRRKRTRKDKKKRHLLKKRKKRREDPLLKKERKKKKSHGEMMRRQTLSQRWRHNNPLWHVRELMHSLLMTSVSPSLFPRIAESSYAMSRRGQFRRRWPKLKWAWAAADSVSRRAVPSPASVRTSSSLHLLPSQGRSSDGEVPAESEQASWGLSVLSTLPRMEIERPFQSWPKIESVFLGSTL